MYILRKLASFSNSYRPPHLTPWILKQEYFVISATFLTQSKIFVAAVDRLFRSVGTSYRASGFLPSTLLVTLYQNMNRMISVQLRENCFYAHPSFHTLSLFCTHLFRQINSKIGTCNGSNWPGQYNLSPISSSFLTLQAKPIVTTITIGGSVPFSSQCTFYHKQWNILPLLAGFWAIL